MVPLANTMRLWGDSGYVNRGSANKPWIAIVTSGGGSSGRASGTMLTTSRHPVRWETRLGRKTRLIEAGTYSE